MIYRAALISAIVLVFSASFWAHHWVAASAKPAPTPPDRCRRIISVAPSITETLYALNLGDRLAGVSRYCTFPPEVQGKPRVGGYYDPNFEAVVALRPDLVIMLKEHEESLPGFRKLNLNTLVVNHKTIEGIIASFRAIGRACGNEAEGRQMAESFENRLRQIREKTQGLPRPRVLLALDRTFGSGHVADVYIAGVDDYFDRILELAGGENVYLHRGVRNPVVSAEGIAWLNPDVIIDVVRKEVLENHDRQAILADWNELGRVEAVRNGRVLIFDQDYASVPGPRFLALVEDLTRALHPEAE